MQEHGKRFPQVSQRLSRQPYNTTLSFHAKPILGLTVSTYPADNNAITLKRRLLIILSYPHQGVVVSRNTTFQLGLLGCIQNFLELRPRSESQTYQFISGQ